MDDQEDGLFVTAGIETPVGHLNEARRLWGLGHRIIEAAVDDPGDRTADGKASAKLKWVKNELRKQLRLVEHLVPGMDADSLELFRLCSYADGRRIVINQSAGIGWSRSQYQGDPAKLKADLSDWFTQVTDWFEGIRKQVGQEITRDDIAREYHKLAGSIGTNKQKRYDELKSMFATAGFEHPAKHSDSALKSILSDASKRGINKLKK